MEHIAPLIQTALWVALIAGIVCRFHKPIYGLLTALQRRIESGSSVKVGPVEISDQIRPQGVAQQVRRTNAEVSEVIEAQADEGSDNPPPRTEVKSRFLEAEDLALRAIQVEYGKPISRQLSLGPDFGIDGAFTVDGELNIVEVKYVVRPKRSYEGVRRTLTSFQSLIHDNHWRRARVILVIVLQFQSDVEETRRELLTLKGEFDFPINVHCYSVADLKSQFGLTGG
jgi:hypothetical protein